MAFSKSKVLNDYLAFPLDFSCHVRAIFLIFAMVFDFLRKPYLGLYPSNKKCGYSDGELAKKTGENHYFQ
jgi:hypothetical protein